MSSSTSRLAALAAGVALSLAAAGDVAAQSAPLSAQEYLQWLVPMWCSSKYPLL